eukprot:augustus_masked-scaffold_6-processed-gene-11.6-mRNA-1 protein AED:1.00 eAED:1.00 QI:0/0/0/0/1/1/2/0/721
MEGTRNEETNVKKYRSLKVKYNALKKRYEEIKEDLQNQRKAQNDMFYDKIENVKLKERENCSVNFKSVLVEKEKNLCLRLEIEKEKFNGMKKSLEMKICKLEKENSILRFQVFQGLKAGQRSSKFSEGEEKFTTEISLSIRKQQQRIFRRITHMKIVKILRAAFEQLKLKNEPESEAKRFLLGKTSTIDSTYLDTNRAAAKLNGLMNSLPASYSSIVDEMQNNPEWLEKTKKLEYDFADTQIPMASSEEEHLSASIDLVIEAIVGKKCTIAVVVSDFEVESVPRKEFENTNKLSTLLAKNECLSAQIQETQLLLRKAEKEKNSVVEDLQKKLATITKNLTYTFEDFSNLREKARNRGEPSPRSKDILELALNQFYDLNEEKEKIERASKRESSCLTRQVDSLRQIIHSMKDKFEVVLNEKNEELATITEELAIEKQKGQMMQGQLEEHRHDFQEVKEKHESMNTMKLSLKQKETELINLQQKNENLLLKLESEEKEKKNFHCIETKAKRLEKRLKRSEDFVLKLSAKLRIIEQEVQEKNNNLNQANKNFEDEAEKNKELREKVDQLCQRLKFQTKKEKLSREHGRLEASRMAQKKDSKICHLKKKLKAAVKRSKLLRNKLNLFQERLKAGAEHLSPYLSKTLSKEEVQVEIIKLADNLKNSSRKQKQIIAIFQEKDKIIQNLKQAIEDTNSLNIKLKQKVSVLLSKSDVIYQKFLNELEKS